MPRRVACVRQHLADQEDLVAAAGDRLADELLGPAVAVHLGGVDQRHPQVEAEAQRRDLLPPERGVLGHMPGSHAENHDLVTGRKLGHAHGGPP